MSWEDCFISFRLCADGKRGLPRLFEPRNDNADNALFKFIFVLTSERNVVHFFTIHYNLILQKNPYRQNQRFCHFPQGKLFFCAFCQRGLPRLYEPRNDNTDNASFKFIFVLTSERMSMPSPTTFHYYLLYIIFYLLSSTPLSSTMTSPLSRGDEKLSADLKTDCHATLAMTFVLARCK